MQFRRTTLPPKAATPGIKFPSTSTYRAGQRVSFTFLPLELREKIYEYTMNDAPQTITVPSYYKHYNTSNVAEDEYRLNGHASELWLTASLVFLRTTTLQIPADNILSQSPLHDFVASFAGDSGYKSVRRIAFTGTEEIEYSADSARHVYPSSEVATSVTSKGLWNDPHHLVMKCTGLRELEFKDLLAGEFYNEDKLDHDALRSFRHLFDRYGPMRVRCRTSWSDFIVEGHEITPSVRLMLILAVPEFLDQFNGDKGYLAFLGALSKEGRERGSGVRIEVEMRVIPQSGAAFS